MEKMEKKEKGGRMVGWVVGTVGEPLSSVRVVVDVGAWVSRDKRVKCAKRVSRTGCPGAGCPGAGAP